MADLFNKSISFLLLPFFTVYLSPQDYGTIDTFTIIQMIGGILVICELTQSLVRFVPESDENRTRTIISTSFFFIVRNTLILTAIFIFFSPFIRIYINDNLSYSNYFFGIFSLACALINSVLIVILRTRLEAITILYSTIANGVITSGLSALLLLYFELGIKGYLISMLAGNFVSFNLLYASAYRLISIKYSNKKTLKELLKFSIPLIPSALGIYITLYIDRVIIKEYFDDASLGLFGMAFRFALITTIITGAYISSIGPVIFKEYKLYDFNKKLNNYLFLYLLISTFLLCGFSLFSKEAILIFTSGNDYLKSMGYIFILALNSVIFNLYVFFPGLSIEKKTKSIMIINVFGALINLLLIYLLIPRIGIYAMPISTLGSTIIIQLLTIYFNYQISSIQINIRHIVSFMFIWGLFSAISYYDISFVGYEFNSSIFYFKCFFFLIVSTILLFLFKNVHND